MELPQIGKRCNEPQCKQLDFLPFACKCNKTFCSDHFKEHVQICPERLISREVGELSKIQDVYKCTHTGCRETSIIPLYCEKCGEHFCISHRHVVKCFDEDPEVKAAVIEKMRAPVEQFLQAKSIIDKQIDENISNVKKKKKNSEMAIKLQLMRVKNKATGLKSIPSPDRVYFNVRLPTKIGDKSSAVFVSKAWTVGRAIDAIASEVKVKNNNNVAGELKLRLFHGDDGRSACHSVSDVIGDLVGKSRLIDGQNLILEYVKEDCVCVEVALS